MPARARFSEASDSMVGARLAGPSEELSTDIHITSGPINWLEERKSCSCTMACTPALSTMMKRGPSADAIRRAVDQSTRGLVKPSIPIQANNDVAIVVVPMERADTSEMART
jgi:hypothetical protein